MSKTPRGTVLYRVAKILTYLEEPRTVKDIAEHLGIRPDCAYVYIDVLRKAEYPIKQQTRIIPGTGLNPQEFWIDCNGRVVLATLRMIERLRGM